MNLYILKYNNYYNRTIKKEDSLTDYLEYQLGNVIQGVAFNPGDGIATQQVVNLSEDQIGDYLLAVNEYNEIDSRWFILDCRRERTGQYTLTLRRDLIADNYTAIISAPCYIEKATLNANDPMIFNSEDMTFNQIKTSETELKDETGCAWVVGYIPRDSFQEDTEITSNIVYESAADITVNGIDTWEYYPYSEGQQFIGNWNNVQYAGFVAYHRVGGGGLVHYDPIDGMCAWGYDNNSNPIYNYGYHGTEVVDSNITPPSYNTNYLRLSPDVSNYLISGGNIELAIRGGTYPGEVSNSLMGTWKSYIPTFNNYVSSYLGTHTSQEEATFKNLDGQIIYDSSTDLYYKVRVSYTSYTNQLYISSGNLYNEMVNATNQARTNVTIDASLGSNYIGNRTGNPGPETFKVWYSAMAYTLSLEQVFTSLKTTINNTRYHLEDQPYDMFCIPYSDTLKIYKNGEQILTANKSAALGMSIAIAPQAGSGSIYDVQLLPYCPVRYMIREDGTFDIGAAHVHYIQDISGDNVGIILWGIQSQFTLDIPVNIAIAPEDVKQVSQTDKWRLCSPNFNGQFEFNAAMNNGVTNINVDCNYKPYSPYIHLNPDFGGLYGEDFNDARGLICGGDFSLPQITSAWADYQLNNKNYNEQFQRSIQNMEVNNAVQREQQKWQIATGAIGAGMSGAFTGAYVGGPIGAVVGGVIGAGVSTAAGIRDYQLSEQLRQEAIDYRQDQFGYSLGNIQAIPYNLTKTSALTLNNKIFPILEYYTCTSIEKNALQNKLYYNGMTVMRIGTIAQFLREEPSYIKGKLIRLEGTDNNFHIVNEIANEINKGVFI